VCSEGGKRVEEEGLGLRERLVARLGKGGEKAV
jgi:hypothetical protein